MNKDILKTRYEKLFPENNGVSITTLSALESLLDIKFPTDFKKITEFYSGGCLGGQSIFTISTNKEDEFSILNRTLSYRKTIYLPKVLLPLYEEYGFIYLDCSNSKVIYCSTESAANLYSQPFPAVVYQEFPSFTDFFAYLLDEEEKERAEN